MNMAFIDIFTVFLNIDINDSISNVQRLLHNDYSLLGQNINWFLV